MFVCLFIYFEREERACSSNWGEAQREKERERERERIPSRLHAVTEEPDMKVELTNDEAVT